MVQRLSYAVAPVPAAALSRIVGFLVALWTRPRIGVAQQHARADHDLVSVVGHELRTPLTVIASFCDLLREDTDLDPSRARMVEGIYRSSLSLRAIVDDLLDVAALESGHLSLQMAPVDLVAVVHAAVADAAVCNNANVRLHVTAPESVVIEGDAHRLRQVVDNLVSNSVKYSPDGGQVLIEITTMPGVAQLSVSDQGIGIPVGERDRLFQRFHRASNARQRGIRGTGLGLALVRTLLEGHRGTVNLDQSHEQGTRIVARLPLGPHKQSRGDERARAGC
jgi:signal transduction histidine kinase